jgi:hypothetical protein
MRADSDCHRSPEPPASIQTKLSAQVVQLLLDPGLSGFADGNNTDYGRDSDGAPQDGQNASHLVPSNATKADRWLGTTD